MTRSVLVTGASGFIGRAVVPVLADASYEVHAIRHTHSIAEVPGTRTHHLNLMDGAATAALIDSVRPSHLLHLAWYTTPQLYLSSDHNLDWLGASVRLLRAFAAAGGRRAVLAGTCAEYDLSDGRCSEATTPRRPASLYGASKNALHEVAAMHAASAGYSAAWARLFYAYGPGEPSVRLVPTVVQGLLAGRPVILSHGHQRRDFLFVGDVAAALVRLLDSDVQGAVNIGSGEALSVRGMVASIVDRVAQPADVRFGARNSHDGDPPALIVADTTRLRRELGWTPAVPLEEGIDRTVRWWRRELIL